MTSAIFRLELRRSRQLVLWVSILVFLYAGMCAAIYPYLRDSAKQLDDYMKIYPKEVLSALGMEGTISDPGVFWNVYVAAMLWPVAAAIVAAIISTRSTAADTDKGWVEFVLGSPVPRRRYLLVSIATQALIMGWLAALAAGTVLGVGALVGDGFSAPPFVLGAIALWLFGIAFAALATLLSVVTLSRGIAAGVVAGTMLLMYLLNAISQVKPDLGWLADLSAFHYLRGKEIVDLTRLPVLEAALFAGVALLAWGAAVWLFRRRDLLA